MNKYKINNIVYVRANGVKGIIININNLFGTNYYLVKLERSGDKVWFSEDKITSNMIEEFEPFKAEYISNWIKTEDSIFDGNVTLNGLEAVSALNSADIRIKQLLEDLKNVKHQISEIAIRVELEKHQLLRDRISEQLKKINITYETVR